MPQIMPMKIEIYAVGSFFTVVQFDHGAVEVKNLLFCFCISLLETELSSREIK